MALARGEATTPALAGQTLRLADWYVRLKEGAPDSVANETYSLVRFDAKGRIEQTRTPTEDAAWPTVAERARMRELLFDGAESPGTGELACR